MDSDLHIFNNLFTEYQGRFVRFASTYVADRMAAEDIVMEAMVYYWENRKRLAADIVPSVYILTSVKNKCLNYLRDAQCRKDLSRQMQEHEEWKLNLKISTLEACSPEELLSKEMQELVAKALNKLPEKTRQVFIMRRFKEMSFKEIAVQTGMSVRGVEYHLDIATASLKKSLKDYLPLLVYLLSFNN
ncbi:RNA polymerase sigma-70 factor [Bacteroides helcogenes]|nr:RNA polymerase sigma-70 factor [Bacteroides helcogenes]MDY5239723.1 RNA polymerase sigma-70 factor [Bacteroides helcogenes]